MNIGGWLQSLGLEQYEAVFRENAIDADVLHDLTEDHLREMGLPLGTRLKLLKAISALAPSAEPISPTPAIAPDGPPADAAEQRDELAPPHSITLSAIASSVGGTFNPSALAVLRLMTNSYLTGS